LRTGNLQGLLRAIWSDPIARRWLLLSQVALLGQVVFDLLIPQAIQSIVHKGILQNDINNIIRGSFWMNEGRVVDTGSHDELMAAKGFYHDLYMSQFRGDAKPTGP
jgi:hypothetical protein